MVKVGIGRVTKILIFSDFFLQSGWGLLTPIFAIFVVDNIIGGSLAMVGFIVATYWVTKSIAQLFIAYYLDINLGEEDDFNFLIKGMIVANLIPLGYFFATNIIHLFILEFIRGLAMACIIPSWLAIFTRHINKNWEAFSWSVQSTSYGFAVGIAGAIGGVIAYNFGFKYVFIFMTILGLISTYILSKTKQHLFLKKEIQTQKISSAKPPQKSLK